MGTPRTQRGHGKMGTDQMRGHSAPPFAGTDLIGFVLAVVTAIIAQGPGTKAKASLIYLLPRAGLANIFFHRGWREKAW